MVIPEDELKIFNETLEIRLEATHQQLKKWMKRWRPVIDHSMKMFKEMAQKRSMQIWRHSTAGKDKGNLACKHKETWPPKENVQQPTD